MITSRTILVEKVITTHKCDYCDYSTENNTGCCGWRPVMKCHLCSKDCCRDHVEYFEEVPCDYPYLVVCEGCKEWAVAAWEWANETAGRHDDLREMIMKMYKEVYGENHI